jgi:Ser-tRNA(Ala) deacylase AlaX
MASIISANIDLTKIEKSKIYEGKKGKYYPITIVLNDELGQYGDSGYIQTEQTKEERDAKAQKSYLGNVKVVWTNGSNVNTAPREGQTQQANVDMLQSISGATQEPDLPF